MELLGLCVILGFVASTVAIWAMVVVGIMEPRDLCDPVVGESGLIPLPEGSCNPIWGGALVASSYFGILLGSLLAVIVAAYWLVRRGVAPIRRERQDGHGENAVSTAALIGLAAALAGGLVIWLLWLNGALPESPCVAGNRVEADQETGWKYCALSVGDIALAIAFFASVLSVLVAAAAPLRRLIVRVGRNRSSQA